MNLVDDIDLFGSRRWCQLTLAAKVTNVINAVIAGGVDFDNV